MGRKIRTDTMSTESSCASGSVSTSTTTSTNPSIPRAFMLKLTRTIGKEEIRVSGDREDPLITGMCAVTQTRLLLADYYNRRVKVLDIATGTTTVLFDHSGSRFWKEKMWGVSNVLQSTDSVGDVLFVAESWYGKSNRMTSERLIIARKDKAGNFHKAAKLKIGDPAEVSITHNR